MKILVKRSYKRFPKTSIEVARELGRELSARLGLRVDLKSPGQVIMVEITEDGIYASLMKLRGPGGLPLGASGRVLGLYSGGAGSALACWFMMKRGCSVDLLHVHEEESGETLLKSEIMYNVERLLEYALRIKVYMASSRPILGMLEDYPSNERSTVRAAFILRLGEEVARLKGYPGLVLGSCLENPNGLEGILEMLSMRSLPVHMPLIAFTGEEVARRCGMLGFRVTQDSWRHERYPAIPDPAELWRRLDEPVRRAIEGLKTYDLKLRAEPRRVS
jgi:thiamine biosynthesis protein ThiI